MRCVLGGLESCVSITRWRGSEWVYFTSVKCIHGESLSQSPMSGRYRTGVKDDDDCNQNDINKNDAEERNVNAITPPCVCSNDRRNLN